MARVGSLLAVPFAGRWPVLMLSSVLAAGCFEDSSCRSGEFHCDGRVARNCIAETRTFYEKDCAEQEAYCVEASEEALCALSRERDERCVEATSGWCLDDRTAVGCSDGFPVDVWGEPCAYACVETNGTGFCALSATPSAACPGESGRHTLCDTNDALLCTEGFEIDRLECGDERQCVDGRCEPLE